MRVEISIVGKGKTIVGGEETMMVDSMDAARIIDYFKGKCILVTGSTGFLGKSMCSFYTYIYKSLSVYCIFADVIEEVVLSPVL